MRSRTVFVTGASTGIGRATVIRLVRDGHHVIAGVRRPADAPAEAHDHVVIDLADPDAITTACKEVIARADEGLAALVNNAGINVNGPFEVLSLDEWRRQFEVNLFGHLAVTKELLPSLLESRGHIITVGSIGGRFSAPFLAPYSASKFAVRAWSDALRIELAPHGVKVVLVEPGAVATEIWGKGNAHADSVVDGMTEEQKLRYGRQVTAARKRASFAESHAVQPDVAAGVIAKALSARNPRGRYLVGADARVQAAVSILPTRMLDATTRVLLGQPK